jgi:hypothetical protein
MSETESLQHASPIPETGGMPLTSACESNDFVTEWKLKFAIHHLIEVCHALSAAEVASRLEPGSLESNAILQRKFETLNEAELNRVVRYLPILLEAANRAIAQRQRSKSETTEG